MDTAVAEAPRVGIELRRWRERRSLTQLALATEACVSTRHVSFVENGRSRPTPEMIVRLAEVLRVPLAEQNRLLLTAGFAPRYPQRALEDAALEPVMAGLRNLLDAHAPYPALLLDDHWNVVDMNPAADALTEGCHASLLEPPLNVVRLCLHPRGLAPRIRNLAAWRARLLHQVDQRIDASGGDPALVALKEEVTAYSPTVTSFSHPLEDPVVSLEIEAGDEVLRMFSVSARIEMANDVTVGGLHLETFLPADHRTRAVFAAGV